jgi:subtilisin family serine protease
MAHRLSRIPWLSFRAVSILSLAAAAGTFGMTPKASSPDEHPPLPLRRLKVAADRFEGDFRSRLSAAPASRRFVALVDLTEQLDLRLLARHLRGGSLSKAARRAAVVAAFEAVASRQQAKLRPMLDRLSAEGAIDHVRPVAILNRVIVEGSGEGLLALGSSPEVAVVHPDWTSERADSRAVELPANADAPLGETFRSWAIDAVKADRLWRLGYDGTGVTVASIDTGALEAHEQLRDRRVPGERGWFDPVEGSTVASDRHGHGTGVLSQAVGGNPNGRIVGIAPGAHWAAALGNWGNYYSRSRMTLAADWILRVARPDVVINAWSHDEGECNDFDRPFIDAWKASGIFVVFPAGNAGPASASGESPAQLSGIFPGSAAAFSVAALAESGGPYALSSRGPSRCGSAAFPTLAAPGAGLPTASSAGPKSYVRGQGTSLSAGLVGGAAALLLQAAPETDPDTLERVLVRSTHDVAPPGRDDATGAGAIDLEAALALLGVDNRP